jgi:exodeoxyribonuclease VII large subunit
MENEIKFSPTDFIAVANQTLEYAYGSILIEGEVASFKVNQGKWVFFDIKDAESSIPCFMTLFRLRMPLEDGMKVVVRGVPKITKWGKFSFTVQAVRPVGEGSLKKAYEILKKKLADEGLFATERKRQIPKDLTKIGVISSTAAAGYADFIKIINARWGGLKIRVAHTQVQGLDAPDQIIRALKYFNEQNNVQMIAILRGGGSADDLAAFNDEELVRAVAASKIPVITGIGHEIDESLCDLAADVRASTPSNAAEMLTPDRENMKWAITMIINELFRVIINRAEDFKKDSVEIVAQIRNVINMKIVDFRKILSNQIKMLVALNPEKVLKQGYAILNGKISPGNVVKITTYDKEIKAEVKEVYERN